MIREKRRVPTIEYMHDRGLSGASSCMEGGAQEFFQTNMTYRTSPLVFNTKLLVFHWFTGP